MKLLPAFTLSSLIAAWLCLIWTPAYAQVRGGESLSDSNVVVDYYEPRSAKYLPLYTKLRNRKVLEQLGEFLTPVKWPKTLRVIMKECPAQGTPVPEVYYDKLEYSLILCYRWFKFLESLSPQQSFATQQEVIVGGLVGAFLHAESRAMLDMFNVPIFGSEEDAADQLSSFVALQLGKNIARAVIKGTYYVWDTYDYEITHNHQQYDFASGASVPPQREYNTLCIAYGGFRSAFEDLINQGLLKRVLSPSRVGDCQDEYAQVHKAFVKTIEPHVDTSVMMKVKSSMTNADFSTWISAADLR